LVESRKLSGINSPPLVSSHAIAVKFLDRLALGGMGRGVEWNLLSSAPPKAAGSNLLIFCFFEKAFCIFAFFKNYFQILLFEKTILWNT